LRVVGPWVIREVRYSVFRCSGDGIVAWERVIGLSRRPARQSGLITAWFGRGPPGSREARFVAVRDGSGGSHGDIPGRSIVLDSYELADRAERFLIDLEIVTGRDH
jgi:hypothetical protein